MARQEVIGRKPGVSAYHQATERAVAPQPSIASPTPRMALSIREFCEAFAISEAFFYKLRRQGQGPREMELGARKLISIEAAAEWRRLREEETKADANAANKAEAAAGQTTGAGQ